MILLHIFAFDINNFILAYNKVLGRPWKKKHPLYLEARTDWFCSGGCCRVPTLQIHRDSEVRQDFQMARQDEHQGLWLGGQLPRRSIEAENIKQEETESNSEHDQEFGFGTQLGQVASQDYGQVGLI